MNETKFARRREQMVVQQLVRRGIRDQAVLAVMSAIPRHRFIGEKQRGHAYEDSPLPIARHQTISQPYIVARMTELLRLQGTETVLEIGTGSGYQAAILSRLARRVVTIERHEKLALSAGETLSKLAYDNVNVHCADGSLGWPSDAPYEAIIVTAAAPLVPAPLLEQLADGGRLVIPVGPRGEQDLQVWQRDGSHLHYESIVPVAFVPMRGEHGWE